MNKSIFLYFIITLLYFISLMYHSTYYISTDSYYHLAISDYIKENGFPDSLHWVQHSVLKTNYSDKELLFHIIISKLLKIYDLPQVGMILSVILPSIVFTTILFLTSKVDKRNTLFYLLLLFSTSHIFITRMIMIRPHLLSILLLLLFVYSFIHHRSIYVLVFTFLYTLSYTAFHIVLFAIIFDIIYCSIYKKKYYYKGYLYCILAIVISNIVHPNFPNNIYIWYIQNMYTIYYDWTGSRYQLVQEMMPIDTRTYISNLFIIITVFVFNILLTNYKTLSRSYFIVMSYSFLFTFMSLMSVRFIEYVPLFIIYSLSFVLHYENISIHKLFLIKIEDHPFHFIAKVIFIIILLYQIFITYYISINTVKEYSIPYAKDVALWMKTNIPENEVVINDEFGSTCELIYFNNKNRYSNVLDPVYFYVYDPELYYKYYQLFLNDTSEQIYLKMKNHLDSRYMLLSVHSEHTISKLEQSDLFQLIYSDQYYYLFQQVSSDSVK